VFTFIVSFFVQPETENIDPLPLRILQTANFIFFPLLCSVYCVTLALLLDIKYALASSENRNFLYKSVLKMTLLRIGDIALKLSLLRLKLTIGAKRFIKAR